MNAKPPPPVHSRTDLGLNAGASSRIVLIRHGRPEIPVAPKTCHKGFRDYIGAYDEAGLDPQEVPPEELQELVADIAAVFTSDRKRAHESAKLLAPKAELVIDPLFMEAPLASPRIPLLRMRVPKWAVVARVLWYAGYHPEIENYAKAKRRAAQAAGILQQQAEAAGAVALVAHGYFNYLIGRELVRRGYRKTGAHRARFWNAVVYSRD